MVGCKTFPVAFILNEQELHSRRELQVESTFLNRLTKLDSRCRAVKRVEDSSMLPWGRFLFQVVADPRPCPGRSHRYIIF